MGAHTVPGQKANLGPADAAGAPVAWTLKPNQTDEPDQEGLLDTRVCIGTPTSMLSVGDLMLTPAEYADLAARLDVAWCTACGQQIPPREVRAGYTLCSRCPGPARPIDALAEARRRLAVALGLPFSTDQDVVAVAEQAIGWAHKAKTDWQTVREQLQRGLHIDLAELPLPDVFGMVAELIRQRDQRSWPPAAPPQPIASPELVVRGTAAVGGLVTPTASAIGGRDMVPAGPLATEMALATSPAPLPHRVPHLVPPAEPRS